MWRCVCVYVGEGGVGMGRWISKWKKGEERSVERKEEGESQGVRVRMICNFVPTADCRAESEGDSGKWTVAVWISSHAWTAQDIQVPGVYACRCICVSVCVCLSVLPCIAILPPCSTQACSTAIRDMWVQEIRRLLQDQFTLLKGTLISISLELWWFSSSNLPPSLSFSPLIFYLLLNSLLALFLSPSLCLCRQGD